MLSSINIQAAKINKQTRLSGCPPSIMNSSLLALLLLLLAACALAGNAPSTSPPESPVARLPFDQRYDKGVVEERTIRFNTLAELSKVETYRYFDYRDKVYNRVEYLLEKLLVAEPGVISGQVLEFAKEHKRKKETSA